MFWVLPRAGKCMAHLISLSSPLPLTDGLDEVGGRSSGWKDSVPEQKMWREIGKLRLVRRVLWMWGMGDTCE
jgi:hypothetical protein